MKKLKESVWKKRNLKLAPNVFGLNNRFNVVLARVSSLVF